MSKAATLANVPSYSFMRNRIINGDMRIDQRNNGSSVSMINSGSYSVDRWYGIEDSDGTMTMQRSTVAPAGFTNSLAFTTGTADASLSALQYVIMGQRIEGVNIYDFGWGTASAQNITMSFWVRSSLTGTFGGSLCSIFFLRSYPFTYSISAANTWELKSITIPGDTSGTWSTDNSIGIQVLFGLGVGSTRSGTAGSWSTNEFYSATGAVSVIGTAGATWNITGVQFEVGSVATPFERRIFGQELQLCQRYFLAATYFVNSSSTGRNCAMFPVTMRAAPVIAGGGSGYTSSIVTAAGFCNDQTTAAQQNLTFNAEL
jgi:hypothetical protein